MLTTNFRGRLHKSLTVLLALGLLGGVATAQLDAKPSSVHAVMAQTTPPAASCLLDINSASKADLSALPGSATSILRRSLTAGPTRPRRIW